jgi:hypothetical protein
MAEYARLKTLYPLADTLAIPLNLHKDGTLSGQQDMEIDVGPVSASFTTKVFRSTVDKEFTAVLVKVRKKVWFYLNYDVPSESLHLLVINGEKANLREHETPDLKSSKLDDVVLMFGDAVVAYFTRKNSESNWKKLYGPDTLDKRCTEKLGSGGGTASKGSKTKPHSTGDT